MSFADDVIKKLFPTSHRTEPKSSGPLLIDSGPLERSATHRTEYHQWKKDHGLDVLQELKQNAFTSRKNMGDRLNFLWFEQAHANGFRLHPEGLYTHVPEAWYVLELLKERVKSLGYFVQSDRYEVNEWQADLHRSEWYYLKVPHSMRMIGPPYEQLFGNVQLELNTGKSTTIKMLVTSYSDRSYKAAQPFDEMIDRMFDRLSS